MTFPRLGVAALALAGVIIAGCSSSGSGSGATSATPSPVSASTLAAKIDNGLSGVTSARLRLDAGALGTTSTGEFRFSHGTATASRLMIDTGGQHVEVVTVGSTSYAKVPSRRSSGKPWAKVGPNSTNPSVRALSTTLPLVQAVGSLDQLSAVIGGATGTRDEGTATVGGTPAHHYALTISPAAPGSGQLHDLLAQLGDKPVPVDLWLDAKGRPVRVRLAVNLAGKALPITVTIDRYNAPVTIKAPPSDQVSG